MYIAYNYCPGNIYNTVINPHLSSGAIIYDNHKNQVQESLSKFITVDGVINGTKLQKNWFPAEKVDVFISHSHKEINKVKAFAGWLNDNYGLSSFIDSCCWGYCDELLRKIDDKYCYNKDKKTYNYDLRNYTTSHVHMMLATALIEVMMNSECVIFFNTPETIVLSDELRTIKDNKLKETASPWILYELSMMTSISRTEPRRLNEQLIHEYRDELTINYDVTRQIRQLPKLEDKHLLELATQYKEKKVYPLDLLYKITKVV